jgi:hypothetical protein
MCQAGLPVSGLRTVKAADLRAVSSEAQSIVPHRAGPKVVPTVRVQRWAPVRASRPTRAAPRPCASTLTTTMCPAVPAMAGGATPIAAGRPEITAGRAHNRFPLRTSLTTVSRCPSGRRAVAAVNPDPITDRLTASTAVSFQAGRSAAA